MRLWPWPIAIPLNEGATLFIDAANGVLSNDTDAENNTLDAILVTSPANGTITLNADGSFTYIHNGSETTSDNFTYKVNDGTVDGNTVTVTFTINPVNDAPVAVADEYDVPMGGTLTIDVANGLLANDTDAENNTLTAVLVDGPTYGTLTLNGDGSFSYEHNGSVTYTDSFTYRADDGTVQGSLVTVAINITGVNNKPVSVADAYSVDEGGTLSVDAPGLLANDTDADNDALTAQMVDDVAHGILTFNADGSFIYVHDGSESLTDAFTYRAYDGKQYGSAVTVTITINPINNAPIVVVDSYTLNEGATLTVDAANGVLSNDTDAENDALEAILVTSPANGIITLNGDGSFTYIHNGSETTSDNFTYKVNDGTVDGNTVTVTFTINPVNDAPVAVADEYDVPMGGTLTIDVANGLLANDTDAENNTLTAVLVDGPTYGTLTLNGDGSFSYEHNGSVTYTDSFTYRADDGTVQGSLVTVAINITGVNNKPVSVADAYSVDEGGTLSVDAPGLLANDTDADNDALTAQMVDDVAHGILTFNADGSFTYVHDGSESLTDAFTYRAYDGKQYGSAVTVTITINPINDAPIVVVDSYTLNEGATLTVDAANGVLSNDTDAENDALEAILVTSPANGTITLNADGSFTYTHNGSETTSDNFTYKVNDGTVDGNTVTVTFTINPVNDAPVVVNATISVIVDGSVTGSLVGNVTDAEGDDLIFSITPVSGPTNGQFTIDADGNYTYEPATGYEGIDEVVVRVCDVHGACAELTINFTVVNSITNSAPVVVDGNIVIDEDTPANENLLTLISDPDNDPLTVNTTPMVAPQHGTVAINNDGTFTYTPNANYHGADSFVFEVCDNRGACTQGTVNITVSSVNDAPIATGSTHQMLEDGLLTGNLNIHVVDADGDVLTINTTPVVAPQHGTLAINADGSYIYTPNEDYYGTDTFVFEVCDPHGACSQAVVVVNVSSVNDVPVAVNDIVTIGQDQSIEIDALMNDLSLGDGGLVVSITTQPKYGSISVTNQGTLVYSPNKGFSGAETFVYRVCDANGDCDQAEVTVNVTSNELIIPQGFSPNGDGTNDFFVIPDIGKYNKVSIEILNRWGNPVYKQSVYANDWDGTANIGFTIGKELPAGTYFYVVKIDEADKAYTGYVYLNR
jgi:large repetitive protein